LEGLEAAPFVAAESGACVGGVKDFWLTAKGTAGVTRFVFGPAGAALGGAAGAGGPTFPEAEEAAAPPAVACMLGCVAGGAAAGASFADAGIGSEALLLPGSSEVNPGAAGTLGGVAFGLACD
jgi:hypothetical protein